MTLLDTTAIQRLLWTRITWRHARNTPWATGLLILTLALILILSLLPQKPNHHFLSTECLTYHQHHHAQQRQHHYYYCCYYY